MVNLTLRPILRKQPSMESGQITTMCIPELKGGVVKEEEPAKYSAPPKLVIKVDLLISYRMSF